MRRFRLALACSTIFVLSVPRNTPAAELKSETIAAYNQYIRASEAQNNADIQAGRFLVVDRLAATERSQVYNQLQHGQIYVQSEQALQDGRPIPIPKGLIHDWAAVIFIPSVTLDKVRSIITDFPDAPMTFEPFVQQFHVLGQDGDTLKALLRVYYKSIVSVNYDISMDLHASPAKDNRQLLHSNATRIAQVHDAGEPDERELPVGNDSGFLWRMYTNWRLQQKDGGVYVGIESISLSRGIPALFVPLVKPLTESIPRKLLTELLTDTRMAALSAPARASAAQ